jgi:hypothetical protein
MARSTKGSDGVGKAAPQSRVQRQRVVAPKKGRRVANEAPKAAPPANKRKPVRAGRKGKAPVASVHADAELLPAPAPADLPAPEGPAASKATRLAQIRSLASRMHQPASSSWDPEPQQKVKPEPAIPAPMDQPAPTARARFKVSPVAALRPTPAAEPTVSSEPAHSHQSRELPEQRSTEPATIELGPPAPEQIAETTGSAAATLELASACPEPLILSIELIAPPAESARVSSNEVTSPDESTPVADAPADPLPTTNTATPAPAISAPAVERLAAPTAPPAPTLYSAGRNLPRPPFVPPPLARRPPPPRVQQPPAPTVFTPVRWIVSKILRWAGL